MGEELNSYVDVFNSYEFGKEVTDVSTGEIPPEERTKISNDALRRFANDLKGRGKLDMILTGKGFENVMAAAVAAHLQPRETFMVKSITSPFLLKGNWLLSTELQCSGLIREYPLEFPLSFHSEKGVGVTNAAVELMESLVSGDLKDKCALLFPTSRSNAGIDFAVACHEKVESMDGGAVKGRRVFVMFQCKDWFWGGRTAEGKRRVTNEEHLDELVAKKIPWLDAQLENPVDLSKQPSSESELVERFRKARSGARFAYVLTMMNPPSSALLEECEKTLRATNLKHIEGVALLTPNDVRR